MTLYARLLRAIFVASLLAGCAHPSAGDVPSSRPAPASAAQAVEMKRAGARWENGDVRAAYLSMVAAIGPAAARWKQEHLSIEEQARRAFAMRHEARMTARAMMANEADVALLRERDQAKYGDPDGPTFEILVEIQRRRGLTGDAIFEAILQSSQRTDAAVNQMFGLEK